MGNESNAHAVTVDFSPEAWDRCVEELQWGDGLPIVPPTPDRVQRFIDATGRKATEVLGTVPPLWAKASVEKVAVNAVMAGAREEHASSIIALVEAALRPEFNLYSVQATTNPVAPVAVFSGSVIAELGIASGSGCFGPGFAANMRIGRSLRLVLLNIGGARPGTLDRATHGQSAKVGAVVGENVERSPWPSFAERQGFPATDSVVSLAGITSLYNCLDATSSTADDLLTVLAGSLGVTGANVMLLGGYIVLFLSPEHAATLDRDGLDVQDIQEELWKRAVVRKSEFPGGLLEELEWKRSAFPDAFHGEYIHVLDKPASLHVVVTGGDGPHTLIGSSFGDGVVTSAVIEK